MNPGEASEAAHGNSDLQNELAEVLRQRAAISAVPRAIRRTTCSPYSTPSSTAQCISAEQSLAPSVFPRKRAFVSLRINWAPRCQRFIRHQSFWYAAAFYVAP